MNVDYIALSVPFFFILIGIELAYSFYKKLKYYRLNDSISNLSQGIGQQVTGIFMKTALFFGYTHIFENWKWFSMPQNVWIWIILFFSVDFFYYWFHRMSHQVNALWAAHIVHHQSEEYNLTVALRQSWFQSWFSWVFYLPLAFLGFDPVMFLTISAFNTIYQFWIHTRAIKNMGVLEHIINTPSHHRVHHGSNPKYIDKNHAGTLIIWDKLFGTFQKEEDVVYYGITKPLASWNPVWANFHYWHDLVSTAR
ncbi:MAG: sterol desaturase family protein, partial [Pedobacter sp.]